MNGSQDIIDNSSSHDAYNSLRIAVFDLDAQFEMTMSVLSNRNKQASCQ